MPAVVMTSLPKRLGEVGDPGRRLQVALDGDRPGKAGHVLDAAGQPVLVLEDGEDDLGDAEGGDGEVVRAQAERHLADEPGGPGGEDAADQPAEEDRQVEAAEVAGGGGVDRLDRLRRRVEEDAHQEVADEHDEEADGAAQVAGHAPAHEEGGGDREDDEERREAEVDAAGGERALDRRHGGEHDADAAEGGEAHDAGVEEAGVAPLHVHAERHHRRDQAEVEDGERDDPALEDADADDEQRHDGVEQDAAGAGAHMTRPRKMPVGLTRRTTTRMMKETANL